LTGSVRRRRRPACPKHGLRTREPQVSCFHQIVLSVGSWRSRDTLAPGLLGRQLLEWPAFSEGAVFSARSTTGWWPARWWVIAFVVAELCATATLQPAASATDTRSRGRSLLMIASAGCWRGDRNAARALPRAGGRQLRQGDHDPADPACTARRSRQGRIPGPPGRASPVSSDWHWQPPAAPAF
jgi:hypothetical protein